MGPKSGQRGGDNRRMTAKDMKREEERIQAQQQKSQGQGQKQEIELAPIKAGAKKKNPTAQLKAMQAKAKFVKQNAEADEQEIDNNEMNVNVQDVQEENIKIQENENNSEEQVETQNQNNDVQDDKKVSNDEDENNDWEKSDSSFSKSNEQQDDIELENIQFQKSTLNDAQKPQKSAEAPKKSEQKQSKESSDDSSEPSWAKDISSDSEEIFDESGNQRIRERAQEKKKRQKEEQEAKELEERLKKEAEERGAALLKPGDLRAPVIVVLGHVDTGKTSLLDRIRRSSVQAGEAGGITQQIGASYLSRPFVQRAITNFPHQFEIKVPGLLLVDTPGHENFRNLRSRGQSLADVGVLVIDIMHGVEPQTIESLQLLKASGAPFVIALNKIDMIYGWQAGYGGADQQQNQGNQEKQGKQGKKGGKGGKNQQEQQEKQVTPPAVLTAAEGRSSTVALQAQKQMTRTEFEEKLNKVKEQLGQHDLYAELWTDVKDLKNTIPIIPTSAKTAEGLCDLIALLIRFCQQLQQIKEKLIYRDELKCTVMEVRRLANLGCTLDCILVNGVLRRGMKIALAGPGIPIFSTVKQILTPAEAREIRDSTINNFHRHEWIQGASGFKITGDGLENVVAGTTMKIVNPDDDEEDIGEQIVEELTEQAVKPDSDIGVSIHGSSLGSLEAFKELLAKGVIESEDQSDDKKKKQKFVPVPISHIGIGPVTIKTIQMIKTQIERGHKEYAVVLAFGVKVEQNARQAAREADVTIYEQEIVYRLLNDFGRHMALWHQKMRQELKPHIPCVMKVLQVFHKKTPVIIGVEIKSGVLNKGEPIALPNGTLGGKMIGYVQEIQAEKKTLQEGLPGMQVAVKLKEPHGKDPNSFHVDADVLKAVENGKTLHLCVQITRKCIDVLKLHYKEEIIQWVGCIKDSKALLKIE